jgi:hypothetical protein
MSGRHDRTMSSGSPSCLNLPFFSQRHRNQWTDISLCALSSPSLNFLRIHPSIEDGETNVSEMIEGGVTRQIDPSQSNNRCAVLCVGAIDGYDIHWFSFEFDRRYPRAQWTRQPRRRD